MRKKAKRKRDQSKEKTSEGRKKINEEGGDEKIRDKNQLETETKKGAKSRKNRTVEEQEKRN